MPYLTETEITSHLYTHLLNAIEEEVDKKKLRQAIAAAMAEAEGYLTQYDCVEEFSTEAAEEKNPILHLYIKDIAVWHYVQLANPNIDLELRERRYELAIKWLDKVQKGFVVPDLPVKIIGEEPIAYIKYGSTRNPNRGRL